VDDAHRIAGLIVQRIDEGGLDQPSAAGLERISAQLGWSSRQIRRMLRKELGVSPIELLQTRRLLLAKQLLTETSLPITEIAFASGFASLRRFIDAFGTRYGMPPSRFRKAAERTDGDHPGPAGFFTLQLGYRPPFDWSGMLRFLRARSLKGVERVGEAEYLRTVGLGGHTGWVRVRNAPARRALMVDVTHSLTPVLPALLGRLRQVFDLSARPDVIAERLGQDPVLSEAVTRNPGLRVPGGFEGFELAMRAILGQQITVKGATTLAGRLVEAFGEPLVTPHEGLTHLCPTPRRIAKASVDDIAGLGIIQARARGIVALAEAIVSERLTLEAGALPDGTIERLVALPGIGRWTAHYIAMRALHWPDAFPREDVALRKVLGGVTAARAEEMSEAWRPWRSYATLHLWESGSYVDPGANVSADGALAARSTQKALKAAAMV
jgi:AraC family transcriptional regulator of adaptative response / DNA-3-methyladenine glycosylase II